MKGYLVDLYRNLNIEFNEFNTIDQFLSYAQGLGAVQI